MKLAHGLGAADRSLLDENALALGCQRSGDARWTDLPVTFGA